MITSIQLIRTHLSDQYGVAGNSKDIRKAAKKLLNTYTEDLAFALQSPRIYYSMAPAQPSALAQLFQQIIETEDLELEISPTLNSRPTISQLKTSKLLPPSRDGIATIMIKEWKRSKNVIKWEQCKHFLRHFTHCGHQAEMRNSLSLFCRHQSRLQTWRITNVR
ncbi:hypothetical protein CROQUDRAFT_617969 [Cronartium quercuum f. sp. fusiforme G11]|uniref:Uncharacterized protein n=1 Tax=Cronartium quercuum f. sp. fusiforme G11 TaxID=708437 RepID=A0A9P6TAH2_9BASI|nr:hypothetical protein CROQUDRAFT_617969 [Cronartium quercuum f. sp. fusiforme G11]